MKKQQWQPYRVSCEVTHPRFWSDLAHSYFPQAGQVCSWRRFLLSPTNHHMLSFLLQTHLSPWFRMMKTELDGHGELSTEGFTSRISADYPTPDLSMMMGSEDLC